MAESDYYTASEAAQVLGVSKATFHAKVKQGAIQKVIPPTMKQGVYPKREIDAMARKMGLLVRPKDVIEFSRSTDAMLEAEMAIGIKCFGHDFITPLEERTKFQHKSEHTFWSLRVNSQVVGYVSAMRLSPAFLDDLLTGRKIEHDITIDDILPFTRLEDFTIYIDVLAMDPDIPLVKRVWYAGVLVTRFTDALLHLIGNGYYIKNLYTVTATIEGDNLVRQIGFQLLEGKSQVVGRTAYVYPLDEGGIKRLTEWSRRRIYHDHRTHRRTKKHARP